MYKGGMPQGIGVGGITSTIPYTPETIPIYDKLILHMTNCLY